MNFNESSPIYLQIADKLCDGVLSGLYTAGQRIPSVREMAVAIEVNPNTVQRTYTTLQEWGIVEMRRGQGYFVAADALARTQTRRRRMLEQEEIPRLLEYLNALSMSIDQFSALCREAQERQQAKSTEEQR
jgi:GntR family transcriptional regulator|tara:strand:+ start:276 stop:668 length:393 start_codon:yes stop_codon:yes gene_type:complete